LSRCAPDDEVPLAEATARQFKFTHTSRRVAREDFVEERAGILAAMDQPTIDGVNTYFVSKAAHDAGLKVSLSGLGGDELLAGYPSFSQIPRLLRYARPFSTLGTVFRQFAGPLICHFTSPKYASVLEYGGSYGGSYLLRRGLYMPWEILQLLDADFAREGLSQLASVARLEGTVSGIASSRLRTTALEATWYMRNQLLRDADWAGMAHSLEVRVPLVDVVLFREVARLVAAGHSPSKDAMASCLKQPLPEAILRRRKTGFSVPMRQWLNSEANNKSRGLRGWAQTVYKQFVDN
jgi:asparagine synthase (glutamine-hydrolysing)